MMKSLSILIPTFNDVCLELVSQLSTQAVAINELEYEILVADDGSTDADVVKANSAIDALPRCRYIRREENVGRSAIRNFLAQTAQYERLLFVDGDMKMTRTDFVRKYVETERPLLYGGYVVEGDEELLKGNLRFIYEKKAEADHSAEKRQLKPYADFHTSNFLIERDLYLQHPLDTRFRHYGYEDVLLGKELEKAGVPIRHIDNPLAFATFEDNRHFVEKTEEGIRTLVSFKEDLEDYSRLLALAEKLKRMGVGGIVRAVYNKRSDKWRNNLCGSHPSLSLFKWYKLGYLLQQLAERQA